MPFHDPRREVEKLREHLAAPHRPVAFLFGAGTSCAVRDRAGQPLIPSVAGLGDLCRDAAVGLGSVYEAAYTQLLDELQSPTTQPNIEQVLSSVRRKIEAMSDADHLVGADKAQLREIEQTIRKTIARSVMPDSNRIPAVLPHHGLARWIGRIARSTAVEIFTTNYDTLIERALEDERVPLFDGFVGSREPYFSPRSLAHEEAAPGSEWCRLWKIHGSVNWSWRDSPTWGRRITRGAESTDGELIYPSYEKYDQSRKLPYAAILDRLERFLSVREDAILIVAGYSFGDQHINEVLFDALGAHLRVHVFALQYADPEPTDDLWKEALRRSNLVVYARSKAIVGGVPGDWLLSEPVDADTAGFLDAAFDSDAEPDKSRSPVTGQFRLGDFVWLGRYVDQMAGANA